MATTLLYLKISRGSPVPTGYVILLSKTPSNNKRAYLISRIFVLRKNVAF